MHGDKIVKTPALICFWIKLMAGDQTSLTGTVTVSRNEHANLK